MIFRCHIYSYASENYFKLSRCIKYDEDHQMSKDYMKILDAPPKCANYDDKHMTNYSNCLKLQIYLDWRNDRNLKDQRNNIMMTILLIIFL